MEEAEQLLNSLAGVISARIVADRDGEFEEIHLLTNYDNTPKQTVRNVESALLAQLGINVDHRKISVAQTSAAPDFSGDIDMPSAANGRRDLPARLVFLGHEIQSEQQHRVRAKVKIGWQGKHFDGEAFGTDLPKSRLEILANAVLQGLSRILQPTYENGSGAALALDGIKVVEAFDRTYVLVGVHAIHGRDVKLLSGSAPLDDVVERSVILATLQATDRWVRGRL